MSYPVDLHTHTIASDHAYSTIHDYIRQAPLAGIRMFATTDHGPVVSDGPHPWHFNNLKVLPRICEGVAVLRGCEANILESGGIDLRDVQVKNLDIVLAGFHPNLEPGDAQHNTSILLKIIRSGKVDVISHPGSPRYPLDYGAVLECAKKENVAVEINSSSSVNTRPGSHDNCVRIATLAKKIGNVISLGTDAHISYFMGNFEESLRVIRESGLDDTQIINTDPLKVLDFLESRGHPRIQEMREFFS